MIVHSIRVDLICTRLVSFFDLYCRRNLLTLVTDARIFGAQIGNLVLFVDGIVALGLSFPAGFLALVFLLIEFEGLLVLASALHIANTRARLKSNLILADFLLFLILEGLQGLASTQCHLAAIEFFLAVDARTLGTILAPRA